MEEGSREEQGTFKNIRRAMDWDISYGISSSFCSIFVRGCSAVEKLVSPKPEQGECHWFDIKATHLTIAVFLGRYSARINMRRCWKS